MKALTIPPPSDAASVIGPPLGLTRSRTHVHSWKDGATEEFEAKKADLPSRL